MTDSSVHAEVELALESLVINGTKVDVASDVYRQKKGALGAKAKGEGKATADACATSSQPAAFYPRLSHHSCLEQITLLG